MYTHNLKFYKLKPYIELARLDKPAGFLLLMWPCFFAIILASGPNSISYSYFFLMFGLGAVAMRGAGCVINDMADRKIDSQVERTKDRPLASGRLSMKQGYILLAILLTIGLGVFLMLNFNAKIYALLAFALAVFYPFSKRFFDYPQLILGITFNFGVFVAWAEIAGKIEPASFFLYLACICWTMGYDTIYGFQDINDDKKLGLRSTSITFGPYAQMVITGSFLLMYMFIAISSDLASYTAPVIFALPATFYLLNLAKKINLNDPNECMEKFKDIAYISGLLMFIGLLFPKLL